MKPSVALVYDKVTTRYGGAEVVLQALHQAFPNAPLFTSLYDPSSAEWAATFQVTPSFLQKIPGMKQKHQLLAPLMPIAFESHSLDDFDIIISITSGEAKGVQTKPQQLHICYLLTPPRYIYSHHNIYLSEFPFFNIPIINQVSKQLLRYLRWWDQVAAHRPDQYITISKLISHRLETYYHRKAAAVLYPPVPPKTSNAAMLPTQYFLSLSRLVPYKQVALSIAACLKTNTTLVIVGSGVEQNKLHALARSHAYFRAANESVSHALMQAQRQQQLIIFLGSVPKAEVSALLSNAQALLMPGTEDYGITAMEAAKFGTPTILSAESGVAEVLGELAIKLSTVSIDSISAAIRTFPKKQIAADALIQQASRHSIDTFTSQFKKIVYDLFIQHQQKGPHVYF